MHVEQLGFVPSHLSFLFLQIMQAILFGFGTVVSPPLIFPASFLSLEGLRARLFRPELPVGRERSLKYPSGGVFELVDMVSKARRLSACCANEIEFKFDYSISPEFRSFSLVVAVVLRPALRVGNRRSQIDRSSCTELCRSRKYGRTALFVCACNCSKFKFLQFDALYL